MNSGADRFAVSRVPRVEWCGLSIGLRRLEMAKDTNVPSRNGEGLNTRAGRWKFSTSKWRSGPAVSDSYSLSPLPRGTVRWTALPRDKDKRKLTFPIRHGTTSPRNSFAVEHLFTVVVSPSFNWYSKLRRFHLEDRYFPILVLQFAASFPLFRHK